MNQKKKNVALLMLFSLSLLNFIGFGYSIQGSPTCVYLDDNLSPGINYMPVFNNSPSNYQKIMNSINNSEWSVVTGYELGYKSDGTTANISIFSSELNQSISQIDEIPANDSTNVFSRTFTNASDYFFTNRNFNISLEVQQGQNPIQLITGPQFSYNAFYWNNTVPKWTPYNTNEVYLAAITEPIEQISVKQNTQHTFNGTTLDGYLDAFYFHTSDFDHDSAIRFRIEKTVNPHIGNLSVNIYNAKSGAALSNLFLLEGETLPANLITKTFDFDWRLYQDQGFFMVLRSLENKDIIYNVTMSYINPPSDNGGEPKDNLGWIVGVVIFAIIALGGIGFYLYKRNA